MCIQVLQQHCDFFDLNCDGVITPYGTYIALRLLEWSIFLSVIGVLFIHGGLSYFTLPPGHWLPDPLFRIHIAYIHRAKHGSDTGAYDHEGRFRPQLFADFFSKFGQKMDNGEWGVTFMQMMTGAWAQRCVMDLFGLSARMFECKPVNHMIIWRSYSFFSFIVIAAYVTIWPADGIMRMEDVRAVYDGSYFWRVAGKRRDKYLTSGSKLGIFKAQL